MERRGAAHGPDELALRRLDELAAGWEVSGRRWVTRKGLRRLLDDLAQTPGFLSTHYIRPGRVSALVGETETGAAVFVGESRSVAVVPPFPMEAAGTYGGFRAGPLEEAVERDRLVGVLLVRLGRYAVGVVNSAGLVASKTDTRYVKSRHRAGGSSQRRFERSRERLVRELYDKVCAVAGEVLGPYEGRLEHMLLGGERQTLLGLTKRCPLLKALAPITMKRVLDVRRPGMNALEHIEDEVWKSRVLELQRR